MLAGSAAALAKQSAEQGIVSAPSESVADTISADAVVVAGTISALHFAAGAKMPAGQRQQTDFSSGPGDNSVSSVDRVVTWPRSTNSLGFKASFRFFWKAVRKNGMTATPR